VKFCPARLDAARIIKGERHFRPAAGGGAVAIGAGVSRIEWTDVTWNPVTGCDRVSPGCDHCYAERMAKRLAGRHGYPADDPFRVTLHPDRLGEPLRWRKPRRVFVNSMSDLFHAAIPDDFQACIWETMARTPRHTYQVLTKRPQRIARALGPRGCGFYDHEGPVPCPQPNVWLGTSIENDSYTFRATHLRNSPAAVRFLSLEPLLGPLPSLDLTGIDWVIVGGESGLAARPMEPAWVRDLRDRSVAAGAAFFFKQWGGRTPKANGRELDGRTWDEMPS
jgi:protein gp37